ncbi:MAG TPA: hypothetical protein VFF31_25600 [Blastocatellia bacterium]|nr:hypothetical protein [Blastocatellia bacterium]
MKSRKACSKARTAASVPGDGGFLGGAGSGFGTKARRLASIAFRDCAFVGRFFGAENLAVCFLRDGFFAETTFLGVARLGVARVVETFFFFAATFFVAAERPLSFLVEDVCFPFFANGSFFPTDGFFDFGAAVILPGRFGFLAVAFLPFVARILFDADKPLLVAFVIRLLISYLGVENEPAPRLNPAHTLVYGQFYINNYLASQEIP